MNTTFFYILALVSKFEILFIKGSSGTAPPPGSTTAPPPTEGCGSPSWATDKWCDDENNNAECNYDGGACCFNEANGWDTYCTVWSFLLFLYIYILHTIYLDHIIFQYIYRIASA